MQGRAVAGILAALSIWPVQAVDPVAVHAGGTGAATPVLERLAEQFRRTHPDIRIVVVSPPMGGPAGARAVAGGALDIAVTPRAPDPPTAAHFGMVLKWLDTPLVFVGRDFPPVPMLTWETVADIYAGRLRAWPDGRPIRVILRTREESDSLALRTASPKMEEALERAYARKGVPVAANDLDNLYLLERTPGAFGSAALGMLGASGSRVQQLAVAEAVGARTNPGLSKTFYLVTRREASPAALEFIAFLRSPAAMAQLERWGFRAAGAH